MAVRWAITGGSWSNTTIWSGGTLPTSADDVYTNGFTISVDTNIDIISLNNGGKSLGSKATPNMTSNGAPSGQVISSNNASNAWNSFDGSNNSTGGWRGGASTGWIGYIFTSSVVLTRYNLQQWDIGTYGGGNINAPASWNFEGSNDGVTWDILHNVTFTLVSNTTYLSPLLSNTTSYTRYRISVLTSKGGSNIAMGEISFYSGENSITLSSGGNFNFNTSNVTANLTGGLNLTSLVVNSVGGGTITINAPTSYIPLAVNGLLHSGTSNLIVNTLGNLSFGIFNGAQIVHTSTGNLTISGTLYQHVNGTAGGSNQTINSSGTGNIIVNGSLEGQLTGRGGETLISKSSSGIISISGNVSCRGNITINSTTITQLIIGGNLTNSSTSANAQIIVGSPTVTVEGNVSNGAAALFQSTGGVLNVGGNVTNTSTTNNTIATNFTRINISGNVSGGTVNTIASSIATIINIDGSAFATSTGSAIFLSNSTSQVYLNGNMFNVNGKMAIYAPIVWLDQTGTTQARFFTSGGSDRTLYSDNTFPNQPSTSDVRNLTKFGPSSGLTGTLIMASPTDVRSGVNTDNTVGTALFDTSQLLAELNASSDPIAQRLRKVATPEILGQLLAAYKK